MTSIIPCKPRRSAAVSAADGTRTRPGRFDAVQHRRDHLRGDHDFHSVEACRESARGPARHAAHLGGFDDASLASACVAGHGQSLKSWVS